MRSNGSVFGCGVVKRERQNPIDKLHSLARGRHTSVVILWTWANMGVLKTEHVIKCIT